MITAMQVTVPEWEPQEGATEILLMETLALTMGQFLFALNQLPRVTLDGLVALHGFARNDAVRAHGQITVTMSSSQIGSKDLPAGARFRVDVDNGETVDLLTVEDVTVNPSDDLTGVVNVEAADPGTAANGIPVGAEAVMVDPYTWIESAIVSQAIGGGGDVETDERFYARAAAELSAMSATLVTEAQFATAALRNDAVGRARAVSLWDGLGAPGTMQGHIAVAVAGPDGSNVTPTVKSEIAVDLMAAAVAGLQVHIIDFVKAPMALTIVYTDDPNYAANAVTTAIEDEIRAWLNPATWDLNATLTSVNQIILRIGRVPGVTNVSSVTGWAPVTGGTTLPSITSISITPA